MFTKIKFCLFVAVLAFASLCGAESYQEYKSPDGRSLTARPTGVYGDKVTLEFRDGRTMNVDLSFFAEEDASRLKSWAIQYLAKTNQLLEVTVDRKDDKIKEYKKDVSLVGGGVAKEAMEIIEIAGYYEVELTNKSQFDLTGVKVEYRIFSEQDNRAKKDRHDVTYSRKGGTIEYHLQSQETLEKKTEVIPLKETKLGKGIVWSGGGDLESEAKMIGVWLRVYAAGEMVFEYSKPTNLSEDEDW
ncbi:hypothetical protein [Coraliomargarita parva]|uniref:hypothetical protein n=1 Tax=Coraliomargarita parva TaxID=3014050 RepID=UPI0022B336F3|nr:hypothetical protein [Coraliomargarita parva]